MTANFGGNARATSAVPVRPVLLLEINEVPWRVIDKVLADPRFPNTRRFFQEAATFTTISRDTGELSPWVTWPSLHRGMTNRDHAVKNLGQDVATFRGTPIWEEYRAQGHSIGICGSLQSWPPRDPGEGGFFIPDTFAHDASCIPSYIEPLQQFNLDQVRKNGRVLRQDPKLALQSLRLLPAAIRSKIRPRTCARIARQVLGERLDKVRLARRPIFQSVLYWDVFKGLFDAARPPAFSTFFTNHVAGIMHRYWDDVFPEDFAERSKARHPHAETMEFALAFMDEMLGDALRWKERCPELILVFATSMGQAAIRRDHSGMESSIADLAKFMGAFGLAPSSYKPLLAMVPQVAIEIADEGQRRAFKRAVDAARTVSGASLFIVDEVGASVSVTLLSPSRADLEKHGFFRAEADEIAWEDAGISRYEIEAGTAYHVPEGVLAINGDRVAPSTARAPMEATAVKSYVMELSGLGRTPVQRSA